MCVCVCVCVCVHVHTLVYSRQGREQGAGRAQAVVQMVVYLTGFTFNGCLAGFREPPLPPYTVIDVMPVGKKFQHEDWLKSSST